jgi:hypothetical protein
VPDRFSRCPEVPLSVGTHTLATVFPVLNVPLAATVTTSAELLDKVARVSVPPFSKVNERSLSNLPTSLGSARRSLRTMVRVRALVVNVADALTGSPRLDGTVDPDVSHR